MQLIGTGKQRSAKTSRVIVANTPLTFASWEVTLSGEDLPTVNFESWNQALQQSFDEGIMGVLGAEIKFGGDWDAGTDPFGSPPGLFPRDDLGPVQFYTSRLDNILWAFTYIRLRSSTNGGEVHGKVTFTCSGKNQGPFQYPTGSV